MEELNTEELGSIWSYEESIDELKQQLLCTTIELESLKVEANEEIRRHKEDVKQLLNLIKIAYQERDEAKDQLQKLIIKVMPSSPTQLSPILPQAQPVRPFVMPTRANSSITESDSLSDTYNHQSHGSSPVDSFFDAVTSPDFLSINMADSSHMGVANKTFVQEHACSVPNSVVPPAVAKIDPSDSIIDNLVKGRFLPQKGNLVQSVMESGPLLQTLLLAGPLPRWRNPPPQQPFKIPPVSMKACEITTNTCQKTAAVPGCIPLKQLSSPSSLEISRGPSRICSASLLNISGYAAGSALRNGQLLDSGVISQIPTGKRQRILRSCCRVQDGVTFSRDGIQHSHLNEAVQGDPSQACTRGLHSIGHSLPIAPFKMKNEEDLRPSKEECAVCLGEFKEGELLKHLPKCTHGFHIACINTWFQGHSNCPLCRSEVDNLSDHECSISVNTFVESPSEDLSRDRSEHHAILRTGVLQNLEIRPHETL